ncbi:MAG: hypothetical protein WD029_09325 [Microthrixaceae bacterium]
MKDMKDPVESNSKSALAKYGPLAAISVVVIAIVVGLVVTSPNKEADLATTTTVASNSPKQKLPEGVIPWSLAQAEGKTESIDWGARCDTSKGVLALPVTPPPACYAPYEGPDGGASSTGVTAESIKAVVYTAQENDPVLSFVYSQIGNDETPTQVFETYEGFNELLATYFETYGRRVEVVRYSATGPASDPVAATSDAETIARDIKPFVVLGGPILTDAFADTLAANKIMCISCSPGQANDWYVERAPYVWDVQKNVNQSSIMTAEYVGKRLASGNAEFGGQAVQDKKRKLGLLYLSTSDAAEVIREQLETNLKENYGVEFAEVASFASPVGIAGEAREILARMKANGVTSILYSGDPLAPQTLTQVATEQDYYPEWVITGSALVDTTIFSRTYDQAQWAHAFGPSNLFARVSAKVAGAAYLYNWFYGVPAPAKTTSPLILPNLQFLYSILQGIGTDLSPQTFQNAVFAAEIVPSTMLSPQLSWGDRGIWPATDYAGVDDQTEVWWDAQAEGLDESGKQGTGMWAYVDGGKRYLPGEWQSSNKKLFDPKSSVTLYVEPPDGITIPDYQPLPPA